MTTKTKSEVVRLQHLINTQNNKIEQLTNKMYQLTKENKAMERTVDRLIQSNAIDCGPSQKEAAQKLASLFSGSIVKPQQSERKRYGRGQILLHRHSIEASINQRYAKIVYSFDFENANNNGSNELNFEVTIDPDAFISGFIADIDGKLFYGQTKEKYEAKQEYNTAKSKDENAILISQPYPNIPNVFQIHTNIDSKSKITLSISIQQLLTKKFNFNEISIQILRNFNKYNIKKEYKYISFKLDINDLSGIYDVNIPSSIQSKYMETKAFVHDILVEEQVMDKLKQNCIIKGKIIVSLRDQINELMLRYKINGEQNDSSILFDNESNTFCHCISDIISDSMMENEDDIDEGQDDMIKNNVLIPRRVIFVIDKSYSMSGNKWSKTVSSTITALKQLRYGYDRYCIIFFERQIEIVPNSGMILANDDNVKQTISMLLGTSPRGGTNINDALLKAIEVIKADIKRLNIKSETYNFYMNQILFITDGSPNAGVRDTKQIILNVKKENDLDQDKYSNKISIFSFGIGNDGNDSSWINDLNHNFLKLLSINNNGFYKRIKQSTADTTFDQYFRILSKPLLSNIKIEYNHKNISDLTSTKFNTLYQGNDIIICGKVNGIKKDDEKQNDMTINASITAWSGKEIKINDHSFTKPIKICKNIKITIHLNTIHEGINSNNIERIWAYLKLQQYAKNKLINDMIDDDDEDTDSEPLSLAIKYKFITPWTSMIVVEKKEEHHYPTPIPIHPPPPSPQQPQSGVAAGMSQGGHGAANALAGLLGGHVKNKKSAGGVSTGMSQKGAAAALGGLFAKKSTPSKAPLFRKYEEMMQLGLNVHSVTNRMRQDGVDKKTLCLFEKKHAAYGDEAEEMKLQPEMLGLTVKKEVILGKHVKMKRLFWSPISVRNIPGSIWQDIDETSSIKYDGKHFELHFQTKQRKHMDESVLKVQKKMDNKPSRIIFVSEKRAEYVLNGLKRLNMSYDEIRRALLEMDEKVMTRERLYDLLLIIPTMEEQMETEREMMQNGSKMEYGEVEKFFVALYDFNNLEQRLKVWMFMGESFEIIDDILKQCRMIGNVCDKIRNNKNLRLLLTIILAFGNHMNSGTIKGKTYAFDLKILTRLNEIRSSVEADQSLLMYIYQFCDQKYPNSLKVILEIYDRLKIVKIMDVMEIQSAMKRILDYAQQIKDLITSDETENYDVNDKFIPAMTKFHKRLCPRLKKANMTIGNVMVSSKRTMKKFAFGTEGNQRIERFFQIWYGFMEDLKLAKRKLIKLEMQKQCHSNYKTKLHDKSSLYREFEKQIKFRQRSSDIYCKCLRENIEDKLSFIMSDGMSKKQQNGNLSVTMNQIYCTYKQSEINMIGN